jgi:hypothetical protein
MQNVMTGLTKKMTNGMIVNTVSYKVISEDILICSMICSVLFVTFVFSIMCIMAVSHCFCTHVGPSTTAKPTKIDIMPITRLIDNHDVRTRK